MPSAVHPMSQAGVPAPAPARVTAANWQFAPHSRWGFCNVRRVLPTARVGRGAGPAHRFAEQRSDLSALPVPLPGGARQALAQVLDDSCTDGFLVLHRGRIVYERYSGELRPDQTHIIMSVSKSLIGSLIGILAERGVLDLARPAGHYVRELRADGYGAVSLARLLDMRSAMKYSEDYSDPAAEFFDFDAVCGLRPPVRPLQAEGMYDYLARLPADPADPGDFSYRSTDTDVLGWVAECSTGLGLERLLGEALWAPLGCEQDADLMLDPLGAPLADGGLCTTLRDLARFAQMHLEGGSFHGRQIVPARWIEEGCRGDSAAYARNGFTTLFPQGAYARQWWLADAAGRRRLALGIHGQTIYLDAQEALACVVLASTAKPVERGGLETKLGAFSAIADALR
jgi:CubicO group peptidase (beta-lactamase class C family)